MTKRLIGDAYSGNTPPRFEIENYEKLRRVQAAKLRATHTALSSKKKKERTDLENLERHDRISYPPISLDTLTWSATDYQDVPIPENSVIYCDIPYKGTNRYAGKGADFDYDRFYEWALRQTQPIFISSYDMPKEDFKVIAEYDRTDTLSATNKSLRVTERIFIPRTQEYAKDNGLFGKIII